MTTFKTHQQLRAEFLSKKDVLANNGQIRCASVAEKYAVEAAIAKRAERVRK